MSLFRKQEKPASVNCNRHHLLEKLDAAKAETKTAQEQLEKLQSSRRRFVEDFRNWAGEHINKRYDGQWRAMWEKRIKEYMETGDWNSLDHAYRCIDSAPRRPHEFHGYDLDDALKYLNEDDFSKEQDTYDLILVILDFIKKIDAHIGACMERLSNAQELQKGILKQIENSEV